MHLSAAATIDARLYGGLLLGAGQRLASQQFSKEIVLDMTSGLLHFLVRATRGIHRRTRTFSIRRALRRRSLLNGRKIPTFTDRSELEALFELASACPANARVLEIGSYLGASTCFLAAGLRGPDSHIVCVDTWQNQTMPDGIRDTLGEFERNLSAVRSQLTLVRKTTGDVTPEELGARFNLIFLDGDHSYLQTRADFEKFSPLLTNEGVLAFHDSLFFEGVSRVVGEALSSSRWQIDGNIRNLFWIKRAAFLYKS